MTSKKAIWNWTQKHQKTLESMEKAIQRETLLVYPNFRKLFVIHMDASKVQLGTVISQDNQLMAFYSRKLNPVQFNYTTTDRELLSIVETLKQIRNILLGQQIELHTDHKNLTYTSYYTEKVMLWRLILEDVSPDLIYIKVS